MTHTYIVGSSNESYTDEEEVNAHLQKFPPSQIKFTPMFGTYFSYVDVKKIKGDKCEHLPVVCSMVFSISKATMPRIPPPSIDTEKVEDINVEQLNEYSELQPPE